MRAAASGKISGAAPKAAISALRAKRHRRVDCRLLAISWRAARSPTTDLGRSVDQVDPLPRVSVATLVLVDAVPFLPSWPASFGLARRAQSGSWVLRMSTLLSGGHRLGSPKNGCRLRLGLYAGFVRSDPGLSRGLGVKTADRRRVGIRDRDLYAEPASIEQDDFIGRLGVWVRSHARLSIELVFANHALSPIDHRFDMVLQDAAGFGERFHDLIRAACAWICVAIGCEPDVLPDRIFVLRHCLL